MSVAGSHRQADKNVFTASLGRPTSKWNQAENSLEAFNKKLHAEDSKQKCAYSLYNFNWLSINLVFYLLIFLFYSLYIFLHIITLKR